MTSTAKFKSTARAALAALVISSAAVTAMPAQAAGPANFGFSFNSGNGLSFFVTEGHRHRANKQQHKRACLSNKEIRRDLRHSGFQNIRFNKKNAKRVRVTAVRGRWVYKLRVNRCNGNVATLDRHRLRLQRPAGLRFQYNYAD